MMRAFHLAAGLAAALAVAVPAFAQEGAPGRTLETKNPPAAAPSAPAARRGGDEVAISVDTSGGFARIGFLWSSPVSYDATIANGVLVIRFGRAFRLPADQATLPLDTYVAVIRQDPDQRTLRLQLKQKARLHTSAAGPFIGIDLLPENYSGTPDKVVDPTWKPPPPPQEAAQIKLRIGVHQDKTRLAFDWPSRVEYTAVVADGKISVTFEREAKIDVRRLNENPPAFVKNAVVSAGDDRTLLEIGVDPGSPVEHFRLNDTIAFDVKAPTNDVDGEPEVALPEGIELAETHPAADEAKPDAPVAPPKPRAGADNAPPPAPDQTETAATPEPAPAPKDDPVDPPPVDAAGVAAAEAPADAPAFHAALVDGRLTLALPAHVGEGVAMFRRGETIHVLIDKAGPIDVDAIERADQQRIASAKVDLIDGVTVLTLTLKKPAAVTAGQAGGAWQAVISDDPLDTPRPVALLRDARSAGPGRVRATLARGVKTVTLTDATTGERLLVTLASGEPQGVIGARRYVEFAADATAQGMLIRPFTDDVAVELEAEEAFISAPAGLTLSAGTVADYAPGRASAGDALNPARMDFAAFAGARPFLEERSARVNALAGGDDKIEAARLELARLYLSYDLGAEALGELTLIAREDIAAETDPAFRALRAAALLLMRCWDEASVNLAVAGLNDDPNAQLMRGVAAVGQRKWAEARDAILRGENAIGAFRPDWQARFRLAGARAALETNAIDVADRMLEAMPKSGAPREVAIETELVRGLLAQRLRRDAEALRYYDAVKQSGYRPLAVRAALAEIALKEQMGELPREAAIEALSQLRWQWRGDAVELGVLHRLGSLQIAKGDYREGLMTLRAAVLGFRGWDEQRAISTEMSEVFADLFLRGKADAMPPVQALGLYYDFKELTPIGPMGDEMVRRLADRLIAVDLLAQAAELLQHQVDQRLDGVAKAQIAAKLAAVYLMDKRAEKALVALRQSSQTRLPDDLAAQRRLLTGRALSDLKEYDAALESFEQDDTIEARRLRADVLWAGSRWPELAVAVELLIAGREKDARDLDAGERYDVLRAAIAYTMADDAKGLASLRDRFVTLMANAPEAAAFELVTREIDPSAVTFRDLAKSVAGVDTLDRFLQSVGLGRPAPGSARN